MGTVLHPACGKRFAANNTTGHCSGCCETFHGLEAFYAHRRGGKCILPDPAAGPWSVGPNGGVALQVRADAGSRDRT